MPSLGLTTDPDPSISGWRDASATMAKIAAAGALMTRSTLTTVCSAMMRPPCARRLARGDYGGAGGAPTSRRRGRRGCPAAPTRASPRGWTQDDGRRHPGLERLLPARRAQAPLVARLQPGEAELGMRGGQVVADRRREGQEFGGDPGAHGVDADVLRARVAAAVAVEAGDAGRSCRAGAPRRGRSVPWPISPRPGGVRRCRRTGRQWRIGPSGVPS